MSGEIHDLVALIQQNAIYTAGDTEAHLIGHVIEYDPSVHMCRVMLPTRAGIDDGGNDQVQETGWIQVGTTMVGNGWGIQYALKGGATQDNPEQGEQVQVVIQHRETGLHAVANLTFNDTMKPPGAGENGEAGDDSNDTAANDTDGKLQLRPAEFVMMHESGSFLKFYKNGDVQLNANMNLALIAGQDINMTAGRDINITSNGQQSGSESGSGSGSGSGPISGSGGSGDSTA